MPDEPIQPLGCLRIQEASVSMPSSVKAAYRTVRVLELDNENVVVKSIKSKGVRRVLWESGAVPAAGSTPRSRIVQAREEAEFLVKNLTPLAYMALRAEGKTTQEIVRSILYPPKEEGTP